jgi:hypothetical protein
MERRSEEQITVGIDGEEVGGASHGGNRWRPWTWSSRSGRNRRRPWRWSSRRGRNRWRPWRSSSGRGRTWLDEAARRRPPESGAAAALFPSPVTSVSLSVAQLARCSGLSRGIRGRFPALGPLLPDSRARASGPLRAPPFFCLCGVRRRLVDA